MRPSIFYLYNESSKSDAKLCQELEGWLYSLYRDERQTSRWHRVLPGGELQVERFRNMQEADLILLLLSADFLRADDCFEQTLAALRERERDAIVIPILLRPIATSEVLPLGQLQLLPRNGVPVTKWRRRDDAWEHICQEIRTILDHSALRSVRRSEYKNSELVGSYRIVRPLAFGLVDVYEATHTILERRAAIKIIRDSDGERATRAMRWEANALVAATHPGVVALYDAGILSDGAPYIIMELVSGQALSRSVFASSSETPPSNALLSALCQIAQTLSDLHSRGIIHCDLKPSNIIIRTEDGYGARRFDAKLIDFGAASFRSSTASPAERFEKDVLVGTPAYISPEQLIDPSAITQSTDVYNLGVVLFELLSGRLPFMGVSSANIMLERMMSEAPSLASILPEIPLKLGQLVDRMLARNPNERPNMCMVADALHWVLQNCPQLPHISDSISAQSDPAFADTL